MAESDDQEPSSVRLRIRREAGGLWSKAKSLLAGIWQQASESGFSDWYKARWGDSRRFRIFNYLLGAFMAPLAVAMVINFVVFGFVLRSLHTSIVQHRKRSSFASVPPKQRQDFRKTRATVALVCLLGLAWLFGGLINPGDASAGLAFQYLFALFVTLQGFGIFLFHCLLNEQVRFNMPVLSVYFVLFA